MHSQNLRSGPEPHPNFIEVFTSAPLRHGDRQVAGAGEERVGALIEQAAQPKTLSKRAPSTTRTSLRI
jgi:hypothetical protein